MNYIDKLRQEYIENHIRIQDRGTLISECHTEKSDASGYHGREILEMLQNADDAYQKSILSGEKPEQPLVVEISYQDDVLRVSNTGTYFDKSGILAIIEGNRSTKKGQYIGNKGTGFRSLLNWAEQIRIFSGEFAVEFSRTEADRLFSEIRNEPQIVRQIEEEPDLHIPMLAVPYNIDFKGDRAKTTIEVKVDPQTQNDEYSIDKQLGSIDPRILLFLPNVAEIDIKANGNRRNYMKDIEPNLAYHKYEGCSVRITKTNEVINEIEEYTLFRKVIHDAIAEDPEKDYSKKGIELAIAVPSSKGLQINTLYSYFPLLNTYSPVDCALHATFQLDSSRNNITRSNTNERISIELLSFLVECAEELIKQKRYALAYKILLPNIRRSLYSSPLFPKPFDSRILEEHYLELLSERPLFLTVNGTTRRIKESKVIEETIPECFKGKAFSQLLSHGDNEGALIRLLRDKLNIDLAYNGNELLNIINNVSRDWTTEERVQVFFWWDKWWKAKSNIHEYAMPRLLKNRKSEWLKERADCILNLDEAISIHIPEWATIQALEPEYESLLKSQAVKSIKRFKDRFADNHDEHELISQICQEDMFHNVTFSTLDFNKATVAINSSVRTWNHAVEFVVWLWQNYNNTSDNLSLDITNLKFPCIDGTISNSEDIIFGESYGNSLANKLFDPSVKCLPKASEFGISEDNLGEFKSFLAKFGVCDFPRIKKLDITPDIDEYSSQIYIEIFGHNSQWTDKIRSYSLPHIYGLRQLLEESLSMRDVIEWILRDQALHSCLSQESYQDGTACITYHRYKKQYDTYKTQKIKNYILACFNHYRWLEINDEKYSPVQILTGISPYAANKQFSNYLPVLTKGMVKQIAIDLKVRDEEVESILKMFGFVKSVTDLPSDTFFGLLLQLQESTDNKDMELSRSIYRKLEDVGDKQFASSNNNDVFKERGKLLVRYLDESKYWPATECYVPSTKILRRSMYPIVQKGDRTSNENFLNLFGCKEYSIEAKVIEGSESFSALNKRFQDDLRAFMYYAKAYALRNENVANTVNKLSVQLLSSVDMLEDDQIIHIDECCLIRESVSKWLLIFPGEKYDVMELSSKIEDIFTNIANAVSFDANKIGELFRTRNSDDRSYLIKKEFGSLDVLSNNVEEENEIKKSFEKALHKIRPEISIEAWDIDFDRFDSNQNKSRIVRLLKAAEVDIEDLRKAHFAYSIDLQGYWSRKISKVINDDLREKNGYVNYLYSCALEDSKIQAEFVRRIRKYKSYVDEKNCLHDFEIENSVFFDPKRAVQDKFGSWPDVNVSADDEYNKNYERLNPDGLFQDEIGNNIEVQRMIYFGLQDEFDLWLNEQKTEEENGEQSGCTESYDTYRNVVAEEIPISYSEKPTDITVIHLRKQHYGVYSEREEARKKKEMKYRGNLGEYHIYNSLVDKYGKDKVFPRSEAFVALGLLKPGQAQSGEYDVSYIDEQGEEYFVEVKTTQGKNQFYMSPGELRFAKDHYEHYRLFLVSITDNQNPTYCVLSQSFWENERFRMKEIVEKIEFTF